MWQKQDAEWERERLARERLMTEVRLQKTHTHNCRSHLNPIGFSGCGYPDGAVVRSSINGGYALFFTLNSCVL